MNAHEKPVEVLTVADFQRFPVWQFVNRDEDGETLMRPIERLPVDDLDGMLVGAKVRFACGDAGWAHISNIQSTDARLTQHFITLSLERDGKWWPLARYHDPDYSRSGPEALARFLGRRIDEIFPISYDVRRYSKGDPAALAGEVLLEPRERLTREELILLAVPKAQ